METPWILCRIFHHAEPLQTTPDNSMAIPTKKTLALSWQQPG